MKTGTRVFFNCSYLLSVCLCVFVHALTFTVYKGQRTTYKNWLSPSFIPGNKMQIVRPGSKAYVLSHPARLKESYVSEWGFQTHSVADSEGLALGKCFCDKCLYRLLWGLKGSNDSGGKDLHALAGRFILYSVETDEFGSTANERKHKKVGFLYGFVLLLV